MLGPRINAGGASARPTSARACCPPTIRRRRARWPQGLDALNAERKAIEREVLEAAASEIAANLDPQAPLLVVAGEGWHPGVIGIVAGRLRERYRRPACVVARDGDVGKGRPLGPASTRRRRHRRAQAGC